MRVNACILRRRQGLRTGSEGGGKTDGQRREADRWREGGKDGGG